MRFQASDQACRKLKILPTYLGKPGPFGEIIYFSQLPTTDAEKKDPNFKPKYAKMWVEAGADTELWKKAKEMGFETLPAATDAVKNLHGPKKSE